MTLTKKSDAAVGSTLMSFHTLVLSLAAHPDVQRQAQAEIDAVFGSDRALPDQIDLGKLPYLNACVTEAQRWRPLGAFPVGPFGLPRKTLVDEEILGYRIPKGTSVLLNQWTIAHDPEFYEEPERYNPDRFFRDPVGAKEGVSQLGRKAIYTFGAGRRECLGKDFFFQNIRIAFSQILWAFDIIPAEPLDFDVKTAFTPSVVMMPKPFKVEFVPRKSREVLLEEKQKADLMLSEILG
jgi:cytochrome P450